MITNRPKYLEDNIEFYKNFPSGFDLDIDYQKLPQLLNFDFHTLNGILPLTKSRFEFLGKNGNVDGNPGAVIFTNPLPEEYEYYESIGATEFQAIQIVINFHTLKQSEGNSLLGIPYSVSLVPMERDKKIDTWNIELMKKFDLRNLCQDGGYVYSDFNPFKGWYDGFVSHYSVFSGIGSQNYSDSIGFVWGMYFLSPVFDKREVQMPENNTYSAQINSKYRKYKTNLYFTSFKDTRPKRVWGCDSPIELFLLQGMGVRGMFPEIQMCFYRNGEIFPNYYKMQEDEAWIGQDQLITAADFYFPSKKLAVFCDGKEFHDVEKDKVINQKLNDIGINTIRFSGKQISENLTAVLDEIEETISKS